MKKLIIALLLCMGSSAFAQVNYVLNPDFETHTGCPTNNDQISLATYWSGVDTFGNISCIPDYCHVCATGTTNQINSVPASILYWQYPHSGSGMAQMGVFYDGMDPDVTNYSRDYLQGRLYRRLSAGKRYCVSFYVCLEELSRYGIKEISAYLDNGTIDTTRDCSNPQSQYTPQVTNSAGVITDTMRWTKIEGSFVANGTESFITIGNFRTNARTTTAQIPLNAYSIAVNQPHYAAYLIDDVSVIESDLKADAGPDRHVGYGDSIYIGKPKEAGLECTWTKLGSSAIIGTGAGIWVKPIVATSYVVTQTLCGQTTRDTVRVEVWAAGINSIKGQTQQYTLTPNPNDGNMQLWQAVKDAEPVRIRIYNALGATVYTAGKAFEGAAVSISLGSIAPGMYSMVLQDGAGKIYTLRFVKR